MQSAPRVRNRRRRLLAGAAAVSAHLALILALWHAAPRTLQPPEPDAFPVQLVPPLILSPPSPPTPDRKPLARQTPQRSARAEPAPRPTPARPPPPRPKAPIPAPEPLPASPASVVAAPPELTQAELAGAVTAGMGSGGGSGGGAGGAGRSCDMIRRLQAALRRDGRVQAAVSQAHRAASPGGRALLVWNGDWIQSPGEEGKGLAGVRQAISLEVAFAPEACRAEPVRGLVLLTLADAPGAPGLALGKGAWRWSDLLFAERRHALR